MSIYVEIRIEAPMDVLWRYTQAPELHERWDLRFTRIEYLPRPDETQPQRFLYSTRIGFGMTINGEGESTRSHDAHGQRTSALKFWSDDRKSLIREGSGYWKYIPTDDGLRFLTKYDYRVRFGVLGRLFDRLIFRPLMGWTTAWSFDRLRLWIEKGIDPALSLQRSLVYAFSRITIAFVWLYHGLIPKLLYRHPDEIAMLQDAGASSEHVQRIAAAIGWAEIVFGVFFVVAWRARWIFYACIALMVIATVGVSINSPRFLAAPFNPVTLNILLIALSVVGLLSMSNLPSSRRCLRNPHETQ